MREFTFYIMQYGKYAIYGILAFIVLKKIFSSLTKQYHSNWNILIDDFNFSTTDFYKLLQEEFHRTKIEGLHIEVEYHKEGNAFSRYRKYLRVSWKEYYYDICGAPFAKGFFVSWWLLYKNSVGRLLVSKIPFVGDWLARKAYPVTYYKVDTASMFMTYANNVVQNVIKQITKKKGIRELNIHEKKPMLNDIFQR